MKTSTKPVSLKGLSADTLSALSREWREPAWVLELRLKALTNFNAQAWPDKKNEKWRRTDLDSLGWDKLEVQTALSAANSTMEIPQEALDRGIQWISLENAVNSEADRVQDAWSQAIERAKENKFLSFTLALGNAGGCLIVPKGQVVKAPLHLPMDWTKATGAVFPLNFIFLEEAAEAHLWEDKTNPTQQGKAFISSYTLIKLKENAKAAFYNLQHWQEETWHLQFQEVSQASYSKFNAIEVAMGGRTSHNETTVHLEGQGAENKVLGVLFGDAQQNFVNWITQNHTAPKTTSDIQYRGALKGTAHSFFSGMVYINKAAQMSDAFQSAKSLLLSEGAKADAIPNLEILADDVKCSHGAAVGPVDEDQKYYLETRGISPNMAEDIIIEGFFEPVISEVPSPAVQEKLRTFVEEKLHK